MKITIYELLGLVKDGKAPKKIKYQDEEYILNKICLEDNKTHIDYYLKGRELLLFEDIINIVLNFNDEVEIIEEDKKLEKIDLSEWAEITYQEDWEMLTKDFNRNCNLFVNKINKIIEYLEEKE